MRWHDKQNFFKEYSMSAPQWQLKTPLSAIVFDCDGTLSAIEGVNELAKNKGVYVVVEALTTEAMNVTGINPEIYQKRLNLISPKKSQIQALSNQYFHNHMPDISDVINIYQLLNKTVYLVSAGVNPAILLFGNKLNIPSENIYAVDISFDEQGNYVDFDRHSPLIYNHGKRDIVNQLKIKHPEILHVGDGLNDYITHDVVTRYVGYGGVFYRENLANLCQYYINTLSLSPLLPLSLTEHECKFLMEEELIIYRKGMDAINTEKVKVK